MCFLLSSNMPTNNDGAKNRHFFSVNFSPPISEQFILSHFNSKLREHLEETVDVALYRSLFTPIESWYTNAGVTMPTIGDTEKTFVGFSHAHLQERDQFNKNLKTIKENNSSEHVMLLPDQMSTFSEKTRRMFRDENHVVYVNAGMTIVPSATVKLVSSFVDIQSD